MIRHFRNVCLGAFMVGASVYQGGVTGFILAAIGIALIIQSRVLMKLGLRGAPTATSRPKRKKRPEGLNCSD